MALLSNCTPNFIRVDDSCGCTLSKAYLSAWTSADVEANALKQVGMDRIIAQSKELRRTGVLQKSLTDLFMSRTVPVKQQNIGTADQPILTPFFYRLQRHQVNANYFIVESGAVHPTAGVGSIPASAWNLTVVNETSQFASPLTTLEKYFLPGRYIVVLNKDAGTGIGRSLQYKVIAAVNADFAGVSKAKITVEPNYTDAGWTALSAGDKTIYQTTHGLLIPLANSVSDYESWCYQDPSENTLKMLLFWLQTTRETNCYSDVYLEALNAPYMSTMWTKFKTMPLAEQKKRQGYLAERALYNSIFFGQRQSEKQTETTYQQLQQVVDPANTACVLEYKANALGIRTQLADCGKVIDFQGGKLDMDVIKATLNPLKRHREIDSGPITRIDAFTDRHTASNILQMMIDYYKKMYGVATERLYKVGEKLMFENQVAWDYNVYDFPDEMVELCVYTDTFFDDYLAAFPYNDKTRGRFFWLIDWSDFAIAMAGSASVPRKTNTADNLYNCTIKQNVTHYQLSSKTWGVMLQDANRHGLYENFAEWCPKLTVPSPCVGYSSA